MMDIRACRFCGETFMTDNRLKVFCNKRCADRNRSREAYSTAEATDLRGFGPLPDDIKRSILLGEHDYSVVMFDIEATSLKPNVGRILCCSFKPLGGKVTTLTAHQKLYKKADVYDDGDLAMAIQDKLLCYDIIVGWNSKAFDYKFVNARALHGGGTVKPAQYHVDGMWSFRSKASAWSGLDSVQKFLLPDNETEKTSVEWDKWMQALGWDAELRRAAMAEIVDHCEKDVVVLEDVYVRLVQAGAIRSIRKDGGVL